MEGKLTDFGGRGNRGGGGGGIALEAWKFRGLWESPPPPTFLFYLQRQSTVRTSAEEHAMLAQLLKLLSTLIKYGYYDDPEDIHEPLQHIIAILDEQKEAKAIKESVQDAAAMESYFRVKKR